MRVELRPDARAEIQSATLWYEARRVGLGVEFFAEVSAAIDRISYAPELFPKWPGCPAAAVLIHRAAVHRFPYFVAFEKRQKHLLVLAIAHAKRSPLYWLSRPNP